MDEAKLIEKLRLIEGLHSGATTEGERVAAERASARIRERLGELEAANPPSEYKFTMSDLYSRKVFLALLRRYGITPYRRKGQRHTTVMARVPERFVDEILWPEFDQVVAELRTYLGEVTDRVVQQVIHQDSSEAAVMAEPPQLSLGLDDPASSVPSASAAPEPSASKHAADSQVPGRNAAPGPRAAVDASVRRPGAWVGSGKGKKRRKGKRR